jgi:hypothetical protein
VNLGPGSAMDETARIINKQKFNNKSTTTTPEKDEHTTGRNRKK